MENEKKKIKDSHEIGGFLRGVEIIEINYRIQQCCFLSFL